MPLREALRSRPSDFAPDDLVVATRPDLGGRNFDPLDRSNSDLRSTPTLRNTPSLRVAGFEDEDDDEDDYESPCQGETGDSGLMCAGAIVQIQAIMIEKDL